MPLTFSDPVWNAMLDAIEAALGGAAILKLRTGAAPASLAAASTGVVVATLNLPADWMSNASGGTKALLGTWQDSSADASGVVAHFEFCKADGTPQVRGSVTVTGGGGDLTLDNVNVNVGQSITITAFNLNKS
jgi:hypothetical protein